jgi:hypothetical protein
VNTTAFCNTRSSSGYVAPSPNGHFLYFYLGGPLQKNGPGLSTLHFKTSFGVVTVVHGSRRPFLCFFIFYHAINLASVNFLFMICETSPGGGSGGRSLRNFTSMKTFAIYRPYGPIEEQIARLCSGFREQTLHFIPFREVKSTPLTLPARI